MRVLVANGPPTLSIGQSNVDYTKYVLDGSVTVEDSINVPTLISFQLSPSDNTFNVPKRSSYVTLVSDIYSPTGGLGSGKILATGFVTNEPERTYLGLSPRLGKFGYQQYSYDIKVSSDEWLLNCKTVPFIPAFVNKTDSQILSAIANVLAPGFFDTSLMASGTLIPYYQYDSTQTWSDIAKAFADANRYHYKVLNRQIIYQPFGDQPLGIAFDDQRMPAKNLYPSELTTGVVSVPPVNDCLVIGSVEPQTNVDCYFVGDGFSSNFQLKHQVFQGTSSNLLQDDWTEGSFSQGTWTVNDPRGVCVLSDNNGNPIGALNIVQKGAQGVYTPPQSATFIQATNGLQLGGGLNLQHGQVTVNDSCNGIIGGVYGTSNFIPGNCLAGFGITGNATQVTASGAAGVTIQPIYNGQYVGTPVVTQVNHQYVLQTWIGARAKNRYTRSYTNLTQSATYGAQNLASSGTITWVITDVNLGNYVIQQQNPLFGLFPAAPPPIVTKFSVTAASLPSFALYCLVNAINLNVAINYTDLALPPQGYLTVQSLTGASGTHLPVYPNASVAPPGTLPQYILQPPIHYQLGFGMINQTAQISQQGEAYALSFYSDGIPGVGSRIRFQSWAAGQSLARVIDPVAIASEASISGDNGVRSAIMNNLQPPPRTSDECEAAAAAAILDREYPQFQGTYTVETIPGKFENLFAPSIYQYPWSGRYFYINSLVRGVSGQNFFVNTVRTQVVELKQEVMVFSIDYGPDTYLEKLLPSFLEREQNLLTPTQTVQAPNPITINQVLNAHLPTLDNAQVVTIVNSLTGNFITVDLGVPPVTACEVRNVDNGWGVANQGRVGLFTSQVFTLPRTIRDQTWYLRTLNGGVFSRFSKELRVVYPLIPSSPAFKSFTSNSLVLDFSGDVRDIYGLELRLPGVSGTYVLNFPISNPTTGSPTNPTAAGPNQTINFLQRVPITNDTLQYNSIADVPQIIGGQSFQFNVGDIVLVNSSANTSFNGLKVLTAVNQVPGQYPTLVPNAFGNYVDTWFWPNVGGGRFNNAGAAFPLSTATALSHDVGNSLMMNPVEMGWGVDPNRQPMQALRWGSDDTIGSATFSTWGGGGGLTTNSSYEAAIVCRLMVPAAGNYILSFACDDGYFYGIDNGATQVSGPTTTFHTTTAVSSLPVLGGVDADGAHFNIPTINFPAAGVYNMEIDYYQNVNNQMLEVSNGGGGQPNFPLLPGYLQQLAWFDVGDPFPVQTGSLTPRLTNSGTVSLQGRNGFAFVASGAIVNGIATIQTFGNHPFNFGDVVCIGARVVPLAAANGSLDASLFTGEWTITKVPNSTSFQFNISSGLPQNLAQVKLSGIASRLIVNPGGTQGPPVTGQNIVVNVTGALVQRPIFAPSDLTVDLTDPTIKNVIEVAQLLNPSGFNINAYFFNLTWDYSAPLYLTQLTVPVISGLTVDPVTQQAQWQVVSGIPTGYRVQIQDPTTNVTYNAFTVDHPHNTQPLTQFKLQPSDYNNLRNITITPFNALGAGPPVGLLHNPVSATGVPSPANYEIHETINGLVGSEQILARVPFDYAVNFAPNLVPSQAWIDVPPISGAMICSIQKFTLASNNGDAGTEFACLLFNPGSHVGTFVCPAGQSFNVGDTLKVIAPTASGNNGVGIGMSLSATMNLPSTGTTIVTTASPSGNSAGTVVDMLDWILMPLASAGLGYGRDTHHLVGNAVKYFAKDTDPNQSSVLSTHGISRIYLIKSSGGNPADVWRYNGTNVYDEVTEDGDDADQATCVANGFQNGCFLDPSAYKRLANPFATSPRFFALGSRIQIDTPGPNTVTRTTNCESTSTPVTLGPTSEITYGPIVVKDWGGNVGPAPTIIREHYYGMSGGVYQDKEVYYMAQGIGQFAWEFYKMINGSYHLQKSSVNNTIVAGGAPTLAFACVPGPSWW